MQKSELLFLDSVQQKELEKHVLFTTEPKPFRTYEEAFIYFSDKAKSMGMNEANFSQALYFYSKKNEEKFATALETYLAGNSKIYEEFALSLQANRKPVLTGKKMLFMVDNSGMFAEDASNSGMNYYQALYKKNVNTKVAPILAPDTSKTNIVFLNDLIGKKPKDLYDFQKLETALFTLYDDEDKIVFRKKRVLSREDMDERALTNNKYIRNIFILQPELYKWFMDRNYGSLCVVNFSYDFQETLDTIEKKNDYTAYYFNFSVVRPYFKTGIRSSFNKKQDEAEMAKELVDFLYGKD